MFISSRIEFPEKKRGYTVSKLNIKTDFGILPNSNFYSGRNNKKVKKMNEAR